jgi:hypothetical protein
MAKQKASKDIRSIVPLAEKLAARIAAHYPDVRFVLEQSERHPRTYFLNVLNAPRNEYEILQLISEETSDILVDEGVHILTLPFAKEQTPNIQMTSSTGQPLAIEIKPRRDAA